MSFRYAAKTDATQSECVEALKKAGGTWQSLHRIGEGCPDGIAGFGGANVLVEIKSTEAEKNRKRGKTVDKQKAWAAKWRGGPVHIVVTPEDMLRAVGLL